MKKIRLLIAIPSVAALLLNGRIAPTTVHADGSKIIISVTAPMYVNCKDVLSTAAGRALAAAHNACGLGSQPAGVTPNIVENGKCGTVTYDLSNLGGGEARSQVTITSSWGPMITASYNATWYNVTFNNGPVDYDDTTGPNGGSWTSDLALGTGQGDITGILQGAKDIVLNPFNGPICQMGYPLVTGTYVTGF